MYPKLDGFNVNEITLHTTEDIKPGMAVMITDNCCATIPSESSRFIGICTDARGSYISVAVTGVVKAPYTGSGICTGYNLLAPDGNGNVKFSITSTTEYLVLEVNEEEKLATILLK